VSDTGTISDDTEWTVFTIFDEIVVPDSNGCIGDQTLSLDYPIIGIDQNAIYVTFSLFSTISGAFESNTLFVIQKESLYNPDTPVVVTVFRDITGFIGDQTNYRLSGNTHVFPCDNFFDTNPKYGYLITNDPAFFGKLDLIVFWMQEPLPLHWLDQLYLMSCKVIWILRIPLHLSQLMYMEL